MSLSFPDYIIGWEVVEEVYGTNHRFCSYCGKELTHLNYDTGHLYQEQHFLAVEEDGTQHRLCWSRYLCEERRKKLDGDELYYV